MNELKHAVGLEALVKELIYYEQKVKANVTLMQCTAQYDQNFTDLLSEENQEITLELIPSLQASIEVLEGVSNEC